MSDDQVHVHIKRSRSKSRARSGHKERSRSKSRARSGHKERSRSKPRARSSHKERSRSKSRARSSHKERSRSSYGKTVRAKYIITRASHGHPKETLALSLQPGQHVLVNTSFIKVRSRHLEVNAVEGWGGWLKRTSLCDKRARFDSYKAVGIGKEQITLAVEGVLEEHHLSPGEELQFEAREVMAVAAIGNVEMVCQSKAGMLANLIHGQKIFSLTFSVPTSSKEGGILFTSTNEHAEASSALSRGAGAGLRAGLRIASHLI